MQDYDEDEEDKASNAGKANGKNIGAILMKILNVQLLQRTPASNQKRKPRKEATRYAHHQRKKCKGREREDKERDPKKKKSKNQEALFQNILSILNYIKKDDTLITEPELLSDKKEKPLLTREQKHQKEVEAYLIIDAILDQVKDFRAEEKIGDFVHIANTIKMYKMSPKDCKRIWEKFRQKMKNNSKKENDYFRRFRLDLQEYYWADFKDTFKSRLDIYESHMTNSAHPFIVDLKAKEEYSTNLLSAYSQYMAANDRNKKDTYKKLETCLNTPPPAGVTNCEEMSILDMYDQMATSSSISKELKSRKITEEFFTDLERVNLLKGILQYGENDFGLIVDKYQFQPFRSTSSLAMEWRRIKFIMMEEIAQMKEKGYNINKCEWLLACIKKCESQSESKEKSKIMQPWKYKRCFDPKESVIVGRIQEEDLLNIIRREYNDMLSMASESINKGVFDVSLIGKNRKPPILNERIIRSISYPHFTEKEENKISNEMESKKEGVGPINYKKLFHQQLYHH